MTFVPANAKQEAQDRICAILAMPAQPLSPGSTESTEPLREACRRLGLSDEGSKPFLAERIALSGGLAWDASCDSRATPSGGGATVTLVGLNRVLQVLEQRPAVGATGRRERGGGDPPPAVFTGATYRPATGQAGMADTRTLVIDLTELDRATALHAETQNRVARALESRGITPISPGASDPQFDIAWRIGTRLVIVEVKTVSENNQRQQVRLGLGQVIEYRHRIDAATQGGAIGVVLLSGHPDEIEVRFCGSAGVRLTSIESMLDDLDDLLSP